MSRWSNIHAMCMCCDNRSERFSGDEEVDRLHDKLDTWLRDNGWRRLPPALGRRSAETMICAACIAEVRALPEVT